MMADNYQDGNYHVYLCHPGLIRCLDMDKSLNKLYDNVTIMWGVHFSDWPAPALHHTCLPAWSLHAESSTSQGQTETKPKFQQTQSTSTSLTRVHEVRGSATAGLLMTGARPHIDSIRFAGGVDQSYSMLFPNMFYNR